MGPNLKRPSKSLLARLFLVFLCQIIAKLVAVVHEGKLGRIDNIHLLAEDTHKVWWV